MKSRFSDLDFFFPKVLDISQWIRYNESYLIRREENEKNNVSDLLENLLADDFQSIRIT